MRTVLVFVVALVLGALLAYFLGPLISPPAQKPPEPSTPVATEERDEDRALHVAEVRVKQVDDTCTLQTYPPVLCGAVTDHFLWKVVADTGCTGYVQDLRIEAKEPAHPSELVEVDPTPGPARRMTVPEYSDRCRKGEPPCKIPYKVKVTHTDPGRDPLVEDPHIVIWP